MRIDQSPWPGDSHVAFDARACMGVSFHMGSGVSGPGGDDGPSGERCKTMSDHVRRVGVPDVPAFLNIILFSLQKTLVLERIAKSFY